MPARDVDEGVHFAGHVGMVHRHDGLGGEAEGTGRQDDLVARAHMGQQRTHLQCCGAGVRQQSIGCRCASHYLVKVPSPARMPLAWASAM
jgi:hypothetical protein